MKFATLALIPVFACFLGAQTNQSQTTQTTTTTTTNGEQVNLNGTLIDQGCYTTHTQHKETNSNDRRARPPRPPKLRPNAR